MLTQQHMRKRVRTRVQDPYLAQKVLSATPEQLIDYLYGIGIKACHRKDSVKARQTVQTLIDALNFEHNETAVTFFNVYRHLHHLINQKKFDEARRILTDIKQTWSEAFKLV